MDDLALSTAWNALRWKSGKEIIGQIGQLGFKAIELNFNLTSSIIEEIKEAAGKLRIKIVSLHNFCPIPPQISRRHALPDVYSLSSLDREERKKAIYYTQRSIDTASYLKAKAVVLHCGRVNLPDYTRKLITYCALGLKKSLKYKRLIREMVKQRQRAARPYFENILRSLEVLDRYAEDKGIFLGIENRFYFFEIPSFLEIGRILKRFANSRIFYWHDCGHAQIHEKLGLLKHSDFLQTYGKYMLGMHLHDVKGMDDHQAPLQGEIDFRMFYPYISKKTFKVIEVHQPVKERDLLKAKIYIENIFDGRL